MTRAAVLLKVRQVAADIFGCALAEITPESAPGTIEQWDSMQQLNLVLALEQSFGVSFLPEDIAEFLSIEVIELILEEKLGLARAGGQA
jgi:acyl carrier protein